MRVRGGDCWMKKDERVVQHLAQQDLSEQSDQGN